MMDIRLQTTIDLSLDLRFGANLISLYALPEDASLANVISLDGVVTGVIGSVAASPNPVLGWVGSLMKLILYQDIG